MSFISLKLLSFDSFISIRYNATPRSTWRNNNITLFSINNETDQIAIAIKAELNNGLNKSLIRSEIL